jgi:hypothetical protein
MRLNEIHEIKRDILLFSIHYRPILVTSVIFYMNVKFLMEWDEIEQ